MDSGHPDTGDWFSDDAATFGDRLAGAREALGMTPDDLARRMGVKLKTLRAWEDDRAEPRANKLQMLAGLLSVSIPWLLTGRGDGPDGPDGLADLPQEVETVLAEMRAERTRIAQSLDRLAVLEKRLRGLQSAGAG